MKKFNSRSVTGSKGSCVPPLLDAWKFFEKLSKKHRRVQKQIFRQVSEIFENLRKKSENIAKCLIRPSSILKFLMKSSEVRKKSESSQNDLPTVFENFRKSWDMFGNARKTLETLGNFSNVFGGL